MKYKIGDRFVYEDKTRMPRLTLKNDHSVMLLARDHYKKLAYLVLGVAMGHRVAYVGVTETCVIEELTSDNNAWGYAELNVHGGVSYNSYDDGKDIIMEEGVKHYWIGFDAAHAGDKMYDEILMNAEYLMFKKITSSIPPLGGDILRTTDYMIVNCKLLIDQILTIKPLCFKCRVDQILDASKK